MRKSKGFVHVYTGLGKGKTTAAMGLGLRAAVSGMKVCMFQFLKRRGSAAENKILIPGFKIVCMDEVHPMFSGSRDSCTTHFIRLRDRPRYREKLKGKINKDVEKVRKAIIARLYDLVILDEIINCVSEKFLEEKTLLNIVKFKPEGVELVLTGRGAGKKLIACADYVTQFDKIKHPFDKGIKARRGIEY